MTAVSPRAAELDPEVGGLIEEKRARALERLGARDGRATVLGAVAFLAVAIPFAAFASSERSPSLLLFAALVCAYAVAARVEFEVGTGSAIVTQLVFVPMLFLLPVGAVPLCVALGFLLGTTVDLARGSLHPERGLLDVFSSWHALGPAVVLAVASEPDPSWSAWPVYAAALGAQFALDFATGAVRARYAFGVPALSQLRLTAPVYLVDVALAPIGFLLALVAFEEPAAFLLAMPLVVLLAVFARERTQRVDTALELSHAYRGTAFLLGDVIEANDAYTGSHSRGVVELVLEVAERLGLDLRSRRNAELTALLHDVGKIRIPAEIIGKPGKLTDAEFELVKTHTIEGERMLERVGGVLGEVGHLVRSCHERWDGAGYPDRLAGEEIPLVARIVCACDAFNAMTTDRPYREARPVREALAEMDRCAGSQFDPRVVAALAEVLGLDAAA